MFNYNDVFNKIETKIKEISTLSSEEFDKEFGSYKHTKDKLNDDAEVFDLLIRTPFYAGMRANTVDKKLPIIKKHFPDYQKVSSYNEDDIINILNDKLMIKNISKIKGSILKNDG
jgi:DNA-3-methyladenine glycosylase I